MAENSHKKRSPASRVFLLFLLLLLAFQSGWAFWIISEKAGNAMKSLLLESELSSLETNATILDSLLHSRINTMQDALRWNEFSALPLTPAAEDQFSAALGSIPLQEPDSCRALFTHDGQPIASNGTLCPQATDQQNRWKPWFKAILGGMPEFAAVEVTEKGPYWRLVVPVIDDNRIEAVLVVSYPVDLNGILHDYPHKGDHLLSLAQNGEDVASSGQNNSQPILLKRQLSFPSLSLRLHVGDDHINSRKRTLLWQFFSVMLVGTLLLLALFYRVGMKLLVAPQVSLERLAEQLERKNRDLKITNSDLNDMQNQLQTQSQQLFMSELLLKAVVQDQEELICRYRPDGTITFVNSAFCRYFLKDEAQLVGKQFTPEIPDEDQQAILDLLMSLTPESPVGSIEHRVQDATGRTRWLHRTERAVFDSNGDLREYQYVARDKTEARQLQEELQRANAELEKRVEERTRDLKSRTTALQKEISDRKRLETGLQERSELLRRILEGIRAAIMIIDPETNIIVEVNSVAGELFQRDKADIQGKCCDEFLPLSGSALREAQCGLCNSPEETRLDEEHVIERRDGIKLPIRRSVLPVAIHGKQHIVEIFFDISRQKEIERQLTHAQKMESIGQLAAGIAHEINTPVQYISDNVRFLQSAFKDLLEGMNTCSTLTKSSVIADEQQLKEMIKQTLEDADMEFLDEEIPKAISQSLSGLEHVASIVLAMKKFSHPDITGHGPVSINNAIIDTVTVARNEWKYYAEIEYDLADTLPMVDCVSGDINQVILNVVVNAAHAISDTIPKGSVEKGTILIRTAQDGDEVIISVTDNGSGIPEHARNKIFDPFYTTKEVGRGTGQGLAISHDIIVNKHGGRLHFTTESGKGTTFFIHLPVHYRGTGAPAQTASPAGNRTHSTHNRPETPDTTDSSNTSVWPSDATDIDLSSADITFFDDAKETTLIESENGLNAPLSPGPQSRSEARNNDQPVADSPSFGAKSLTAKERGEGFSVSANDENESTESQSHSNEYDPLKDAFS